MVIIQIGLRTPSTRKKAQHLCPDVRPFHSLFCPSHTLLLIGERFIFWSTVFSEVKVRKSLFLEPILRIIIEPSWLAAIVVNSKSEQHFYHKKQGYNQEILWSLHSQDND